MYKLFLYLICNDWDWRQILKPETPPKYTLKSFCYKSKDTKKIKKIKFPKPSI